MKGTGTCILDPGAVERRVTAQVASLIAALGMLAACVPAPDGQWFTPKGVPLGKIDCISPAPLAGVSGREICKARLIAVTAEDSALCEAQGGAVGPVSVVDKRLACTWAKAAE